MAPNSQTQITLTSSIRLVKSVVQVVVHVVAFSSWWSLSAHCSLAAATSTSSLHWLNPSLCAYLEVLWCFCLFASFAAASSCWSCLVLSSAVSLCELFIVCLLFRLLSISLTKTHGARVTVSEIASSPSSKLTMNNTRQKIKQNSFSMDSPQWLVNGQKHRELAELQAVKEEKDWVSEGKGVEVAAAKKQCAKRDHQLEEAIMCITTLTTDCTGWVKEGECDWVRLTWSHWTVKKRDVLELRLKDDLAS